MKPFCLLITFFCAVESFQKKFTPTSYDHDHMRTSFARAVDTDSKLKVSFRVIQIILETKLNFLSRTVLHTVW